MGLLEASSQLGGRKSVGSGEDKDVRGEASRQDAEVVEDVAVTDFETRLMKEEIKDCQDIPTRRSERKYENLGAGTLHAHEK